MKGKLPYSTKYSRYYCWTWHFIAALDQRQTFLCARPTMWTMELESTVLRTCEQAASQKRFWIEKKHSARINSFGQEWWKGLRRDYARSVLWSGGQSFMQTTLNFRSPKQYNQHQVSDETDPRWASPNPLQGDEFIEIPAANHDFLGKTFLRLTCHQITTLCFRLHVLEDRLQNILWV